ncbi:hypothetical protein [Janthinobacterium lividum]
MHSLLALRPLDAAASTVDIVKREWKADFMQAGASPQQAKSNLRPRVEPV